MVDEVAHQVRVRLPRPVATAIQHSASKNGLRPGTFSRMLVRNWLRTREMRARDDRLPLLPSSHHVAGDVALKVLFTEQEWKQVRLLSDSEDDSVGGFVARILRTAYDKRSE